MKRNDRSASDGVLNGASKNRLSRGRGYSPVEAGRDDGDANLALHRRLVHGAEDDLGVVTDGVVNDLVDLVDFAEREVRAAGDVDEHARRAGDADVVEQRAERSPAARLPSRGSRRGRCRCP